MKSDVFQIVDSIGAFGGIRGHNPPENEVLQHFQQVLSLNIGDTERGRFGVTKAMRW